MERLIYKGSISSITDAVQDANYILNNELFHYELSLKQSFDFSNASGKIISELIKSSKIVASVETYKSVALPPWSRANAYTLPNVLDKIFLNRRKLNRSFESIAATLVHEYVHLIDYESKEYHFGHGDNSSSNKENTAPYWIDMLAYKLLTGKEPNLVFHHIEQNEQ